MNTSIIPSEPTPIVLVDGADNLSASVFRPANLDKIAALTAGELHQELVGSFISGVENSIWIEALAVDARRRMADREPVGGHTVWSAYVNEYFRRENESLETVLRRLRRLLQGVEHRGKKFKNKKPKTKTNTDIVEGSLIRDATATFYLFRRKADGAMWNRDRFVDKLQCALPFDRVDGEMKHVIRAEKREFARVHKDDKNPPKFNAENYEWVKVEASYSLAAVHP